MYPVSVSIEPAIARRNRLTTAFRLLLAIPHLILVGGAGLAFSSGGDSRTTLGSEEGLLGAVAALLAIISWFTIVIAGATADWVGVAREFQRSTAASARTMTAA